MTDHPALVAWHSHRRSCRACTRRLAGGNRIEEIPCDVGYPLFRAGVAASDSLEVDKRMRERVERAKRAWGDDYQDFLSMLDA